MRNLVFIYFLSTEMSAIFEQASVWNPYDVVRIEQRTPRRYDVNGKIIKLDEKLADENGFEDKNASSPNREEKSQGALDTRDASSTGSN